jgi:hypothetical protein
MKTKTTTADIADMVEYSLNETKPTVKTRRGTNDEIELKLGRVRSLVKVTKPVRKQKAKAQAG